MPTTDPRIDAYIAAAGEFAQPILHHLRAIVHEACPEVEETTKWSFPHFQYKGMLCSMAAFKAHCAFGFWKAELLLAGSDSKTQEAMGQFGRIVTVADLPSKKILIGYIKRAMQLNDDNVKAPSRAKTPVARPLDVPEELLAALAAAQPALDNFNAFNTSTRRDYVDWINEAKTEATRLRRLAQAVELSAEGKSRNWKYANC